MSAFWSDLASTMSSPITPAAPTQSSFPANPMEKTDKFASLKMVLAPGPSSAGDHLLARGPGPNDLRECVVCLEPLSAPVKHKHFQNCHGQQVCDGCASKVDSCPLCRIPKKFGTGATISLDLEKTSDCCSSVDCSAPVEQSISDELYDSGQQSEGESEAESVPSPSFFLFQDELLPTVPQQQTTPSAPLVENDLESILSDLYNDTLLKTDVAPTVPVNADVDVKPVIVEKTERPKRGQKKKSEQKVPKIEKNKISPAGKSKKNKAEIGHDSPFAGLGLTDSKVCAMPFQELVDVMNSAGFSKQQVAAGKLYRKRLKNRQHVMEYSSRKKQSTASLAEQNKELKASIAALQTQNTELVVANKRLTEELNNANKAQVQARFEMSALQEQINQLQRVIATLKA